MTITMVLELIIGVGLGKPRIVYIPSDLLIFRPSESRIKLWQ